MPLEDWLGAFNLRSTSAEPLPPEERATTVALVERRPAHFRYLVTSADGVEREVEVSAFPLFAHTDEFVGVIGFFWRI